MEAKCLAMRWSRALIGGYLASASLSVVKASIVVSPLILAKNAIEYRRSGGPESLFLGVGMTTRWSVDTHSSSRQEQIIANAV
jgi:hypothetical protein